MSEWHEDYGVTCIIYRQPSNRDLAERDARHTLYHEVGHNVYWNVLPAKLRSRWDEINFRGGPEGCISEYAKTSKREDFCETYAFYITAPHRLRAVSPEKYQFMLELVFKGREYGCLG
jgi:hypothetical protein